MRNKAIATAGLAIGFSLAPNVAPALAGQGGVSPEAGKQGGITAGKPEVPTPVGGVSAEGTPRNANLAAKIRYIKDHLKNDTQLNFLTLDPKNRNAHIEVASDDEGPMINPLTVLSADGSAIEWYASRKGKAGVELMRADEAEVKLYMGSQLVEVVTNPSDFLAPHTLRPTPDHNKGPFTLTAENGELFAAAP